MIKIAVIGHKEVPSYNGGIEAVLTETLPLFNKDEFQLTVYNRWDTFYNPKEWFKKQEYAGCKIVRIPTFRNSLLNAFIYSLFASIHAAVSTNDIVHYHAEGPSAMAFIPKFFNKKIICTNHGLDWDRSKWGNFATKYLKFGEKMSAKVSDRLIVLNFSIAKYFNMVYNKDTNIIRNGINLNKRIQTNEITARFNLNKDEYFLAMGRLVPEKGFHYLIEAFSKVETNKKLVIAGELTDSDYCVSLKNLATNNPNVIFTDFVSGTVKQELFSNCFAYVIPSDLEGMSISLLEALGYGCKVIASDIEENKNICDDYIAFFRQGNVQDLIHILSIVAPHPTSLREEQIKHIKNHFNWQAAVTQTENLYREVMGLEKPE